MASLHETRQPSLFDPERAESGAERLAHIARDAADCRACPLWEIGTRTVFGAGPAHARLMFVGEAPGLQEDRQGVPFVGPAGRLFDEALAQASLDRAAVYVTNVVNHRPWVSQNGRQKNRAPEQSEVTACRPWLQQELRLVSPAIVVALGAAAARELLGRDFKLTRQRGLWFDGPDGQARLATIHPSYVLIQPEESYASLKETLFADLRLVAERYRSLPPRPTQPA